jgi:hypothetical protein
LDALRDLTARWYEALREGPMQGGGGGGGGGGVMIDTRQQSMVVRELSRLANTTHAAETEVRMGGREGGRGGGVVYVDSMVVFLCHLFGRIPRKFLMLHTHLVIYRLFHIFTVYYRPSPSWTSSASSGSVFSTSPSRSTRGGGRGGRGGRVVVDLEEKEDEKRGGIDLSLIGGCVICDHAAEWVVWWVGGWVGYGEVEKNKK